MKKVFNTFYSVVMVFCKLMLIADCCLVAVVVAGRFLHSWTKNFEHPISPPSWSEDILLTCMVYMALISAAMALRRNAHIRMTAFDNNLSPRLVKALDILADVAVLIFAVIMIVEGWKYASGTKGFFTSLPWLSRFWLFFSVPLAGACMFIFQCESAVTHVLEFISLGRGGKSLPQPSSDTQKGGAN